jgi:hypothetical protein
MPQNANDAMWDPRPRLVREADHVNGGDSEGAPAEQKTAETTTPTQDPDVVLVELASDVGMSPTAAVGIGRSLEALGFALDEEFGAIPLRNGPEDESFLVRGRVSDPAAIDALERDPRVVKVWRDTPVAPF